jgi:hypothetical protein
MPRLIGPEIATGSVSTFWKAISRRMIDRKKTRAAYAIDLKQFLGFPNWTAFLEQQ